MCVCVCLCVSLSVCLSVCLSLSLSLSMRGNTDLDVKFVLKGFAEAGEGLDVSVIISVPFSVMQMRTTKTESINRIFLSVREEH